MPWSGRSKPLAFAFFAGSLFAVATPWVSAQTTTTTTTLTPAQQAAKAKRDADIAAAAKVRAQHDAQVAAVAAARAQAAAAKAQAANGTATTSPATTPASNPHVNPWAAQRAGAAATPHAAAGATATTTQAPAAAGTTTTTPAPAQGSFFSRFMNNGSTSGTPAASASSGAGATTSAGRTAGNNTFAAGLGRFTYGDTSAVLYGCMRSGTRVFCDYDEFRNSVGQANANWAATMVLSGGRTVNQHSATYVDTDGSSFPTAELNPSTGVRMVVEYDDVPETQTAVAMVVGSTRIQNVPVTEMNLQANGNLAPRGAGNVAGGQQGGGAAGTPAGQTTNKATNAVDNANTKVTGATQTVNSTKQGLSNIWNNVKKPQ